MSIHTWTGRFSIVEGQVREEGPWLGTFTRRLPDDEERTLHILVEPAFPGSEDICAQLVEAVGHLFVQKENLSLTGALGRSLRAAHQDLCDWNHKSLRDHQVGAGASCLVLRGRTAYLAQVGPSLAFFFRDGELTRLTPQEPSAHGPLGLADELRPELSAFELEPGDLLLLVSPRLASVADQATIAGILSRGADDALAETYLLTRDFANFSALLAACFDQSERAPGPVASEAGLSMLAPDVSPQGPAQEVDTAESAEPDAEGGGPPAAPPALEPEGRSELSSGSGPPAAVASPQSTPTAPHLPGFESGGGPFPRNGGNGHSRTANPYGEVVARIDSPPARASRPVVRLRGQDMVRPYRFSRTTTPRIRNVSIPWLWVPLAAILGFVGILAVCTIPGSSSPAGSPGVDVQALLVEADAAYRAALGVEDPSERRIALTAVLERLDQAEGVEPAGGELENLRAEVRASLATLDAVVDLGELDLVVDLGPLVSGDLSAQRLVLGGGSIFVLDDARGRVLELPLAPAAAPLPAEADPSGEEYPLVRTVLQEGELAGVVKAGHPRFAVWSRQPDGSGRLLIMDEGRRLYGYTPGGSATPLVLRGADEWGSVDGAAAFAGNLYVLDIESSQVWRYLPTDSGFDSERTGVLVDTDLSDATELAVDSDVYLLTGDGRIRRFVDGEERPFAMSGIDRALLSPASLAGDGASGLLVTDRGNKRLVLFGADGLFQRQLVSATFTDLRSAAADAETGRIYVIVGDSVFAAELPSP